MENTSARTSTATSIIAFASRFFISGYIPRWLTQNKPTEVAESAELPSDKKLVRVQKQVANYNFAKSTEPIRK